MKLIESKVTAWAAMVLVAILVVLCCLMRTPWYGFIDVFFFFLAVFSHLSSLYLRRMSPAAGRKLETCAFVCIVLGVVAFLAEYVILYFQS